MTRLHLDKSFSLKRFAIVSILVPSLALAAGCVGVEGEEDSVIDEGAANLVEEGAANLVEGGEVLHQELAPAPVAIFAYNPDKIGTVRMAMEVAGAKFTTDNYEAVIVHVDASNTASLVPVVKEFLKQGKHVVLDSKGSLADRIAVGELTGAAAGMILSETAVSIVQHVPGAFTVTPIDTTPTLASVKKVSGNTPLAVLGASYIQPVPTTENSASTITKYYVQAKGAAAPKLVPSYVDNESTYVQSSSSGSDLKRYLYRGSNIQQCAPGSSQDCPMTWGETYTKEVSHGTSIDVDFSNALTEKLTGGVTLGYSLTLTTSKTLSWTNTVYIKPGTYARPVSFIWRKKGSGSVKNAYIHTSRKKVPLACKPTGGCYGVTDTYQRQANTVVGSWSANIRLNQGAVTNSWVTFATNSDPTSYVFD